MYTEYIIRNWYTEIVKYIYVFFCSIWKILNQAAIVGQKLFFKRFIPSFMFFFIFI